MQGEDGMPGLPGQKGDRGAEGMQGEPGRPGPGWQYDSCFPTAYFRRFPYIIH